MAGELMTFGEMLTLFNGCEPRIRALVAHDFGIADEVLASWLKTLNTVRNIGAHHARLWNRELGTQPLIPRERKHPEWHHPVAITPHRIFAALSVLRYLMHRVCRDSHWQIRFEELLREYPEIDITDMGFPPDWKNSPLWRHTP